MESDATTTPGGTGASTPRVGPRRKPRRRSARSAGPPAELSGPAESSRPAESQRPADAAEPIPLVPADKPERPSAPKRPPARRAPGERGRNDSMDRQWRELAGSGRSQVSLSAALRARNAEQPTPADLAEAEASVVVQHRNWIPTNDG